MDNLFKDTKFGDRFRTRDGLLAIFVGQSGTGRVIYICKPAGNEGFAETHLGRFGMVKNFGIFAQNLEVHITNPSTIMRMMMGMTCLYQWRKKKMYEKQRRNNYDN